MLFNSYIFLLVFLPAVLLLHFGLLARLGLTVALAGLAVASLAFYAWWNPAYVGLIALSMLFNYAIGSALTASAGRPIPWRRALLGFGVVANLAMLAYYKYANFFVDSVNAATDTHFVLHRIVLPLGVSFFTFEQVSYVVDAYRDQARRYTPVEYVFFVTFFPHLIAGPIISHGDLLGQVRDASILRFSWEKFATGATLLAMGLFKKVVVADPISGYVTPTFAQVAAGNAPDAVHAWLSIFAYSLQLYFDFSGYSDMAVGLAQMFNLRLPLNFDSPYKAVNPSDFWRRWHRTLSRFMRDYVYIPLGGNRGSKARRYANLLITMTLGGLWHGAGWGFVIWGAINGLLQVGSLMMRSGKPAEASRGFVRTQTAITLTFVAIMLSRVFFRCVTFAGAMTYFASLLGQHGSGLAQIGQSLRPIVVCVAAYLWTRLAPNTHELTAHRDPVCPAVPVRATWRFRPSTAWGLITGAMVCAALLNLTHVSEFLYFQF